MKNQATETPRSTTLGEVDFEALEVPTYQRKGVTVTETGSVITVSRPATAVARAA
ncbi:hypothetical protein P2W50_31455 [Pseudomonas protegens]|uniref:hypothetical protein n=1 Tax=Pseudomonas protegens TaxID=380021 RepID=UPI0023ECF288|nr:hypothetical protein [Pseudomonas protegens]MDF4211171.1 hypothetical protein [Pseudomonas protegens]